MFLVHLGGNPTPVIMQYLPQNQANNGIQYLQLIPTRPLIVPISPYITQLPQQYRDVSAGQQQTTVSAQYSAVGPQTFAPTQLTNNQHYAAYHNPIGGYSSAAPVISFFRPHTGIQLVNGPVDMSLNTNEYIPIQSESAYKINRRP